MTKIGEETKIKKEKKTKKGIEKELEIEIVKIETEIGEVLRMKSLEIVTEMTVALVTKIEEDRDRDRDQSLSTGNLDHLVSEMREVKIS